MSVDYHELLWQQLNKSFAKGSNDAFVLAVGKFLLYANYSEVNDNAIRAAFNTFELTDTCIGCSANYNPTGSKISMLWDQLLNQGKGPQAGPEQQAAFEQARSTLFKVWDTRTPTPFYQSYIDAKSAYLGKTILMKAQYKKEYGDGWEELYDQVIVTTPEYLNYQRLDKDVAPLLKAIDEWVYGPLYGTLAPMKKAYEDNKREVYLKDQKITKNFMYVSMIPSNWYQWLDRDQLDDPAWITITVDEKSFDATQSREYKRLGGSVSVGYSFLSLKLGGEGSQEKRIETGDSRGVTISFKVRSVEINRPWVDPSALKVEKWILPGLSSGAWSTGVLDNSNKGSFPLLTTQMIVAKDITITAAKFSKEVTDNLTKFDAKVGVGVIYGLFSFGLGAGGGSESESHSFHFDASGSSITLKIPQVIGYTGTLMSKYAV